MGNQKTRDKDDDGREKKMEESYFSFLDIYLSLFFFVSFLSFTDSSSSLSPYHQVNKKKKKKKKKVELSQAERSVDSLDCV